MSTYYEIWKANEATAQQAVMVLMGMALALVLGWLLIPVMLPGRLATAGRWGYIFVMLVLAGASIVWGQL